MMGFYWKKLCFKNALEKLLPVGWDQVEILSYQEVLFWSLISHSILIRQFLNVRFYLSLL